MEQQECVFLSFLARLYDRYQQIHKVAQYLKESRGGIYFTEEVQMLGRIKKGESVIGMRAVRVKDWTFFKGPPIVRGSYAGKMRDWYMVQTRRGKTYLCSDIKKAD